MADLNWAPYAISADGANSAIHGPLPRAGGELSFPFTWQQLQQIVANLVNEFLRQVAVALGAIEIFGFKPYEALVEIGEKIQEGVDNFNILLSAFGLPTVNDVATLLSDQANDFTTFLAATGQATFAALGAALQALIDFLTAIPANLLSGAMPTTVTLSGTQLGTLLQYLSSSGQFNAAQLTGGLNSAVTFGGTALSTFFGNINSSGGLLASGLTGAFNGAVTLGGNSFTNLLQYLNSSGQFAAGQLTGAINGGLTLGGVTLSTLVTNINSSGQILAAGITGALGTTLTVGGVQLGTLFTNINSLGQILGAGITGSVAAALISGTTTAQQQLQDAVAQVFNPLAGANNSIAQVATQAQNSLGGLLPAIMQNANGTATALTSAITMNSNGTATYVSNGIHALVDQANGTMATVAQSFQQAAQAAISQTGSNFTAAAAAGQSLLNSLFGAFGLGAGGAVPAATPAQATQAVIDAQKNITDNAAGLAALNATLQAAANGGGTSVSVAFASYPDSGTLPAAFTTFSNAMEVSGGYAIRTSGDPAMALAVENTHTTQTDKQIVSGIFTGVSSSTPVSLLGRVNSAGTAYISAYYGAGNKWYLRAIVGGIATPLTDAADTFSAGATYSLVCGTAGGDRIFQILKNGNPLTFSTGSTSYTEVGTGSQLGASYRGGGFGLSNTAKLSTWTIVDNAAGSVVGSGFRAYRTTTTPVTLSAGDNLLPNSFFNTVDAVTADLTSAPASNNKVTISVSGWYVVTVGLAILVGSGGSAGPVLYKNGSVIRHGAVNTSLTGSGSYPVLGTFVVYCAAGDYLQPGVYCDAGSVSSTKGEATGTWTYWELAFANRGTLS